MNVGDKVIVDGKETEITAIAFDDLGVKVYTVKGSMKDYYEEELKLLEEDIIKIAESLGYIVGKYGGEKEAKLLNGLVVDCQNKANTIEKLKKENKEQEKMIDLMAQYIDFDKMDFNCSNLCVHDGCIEECVIKYFKKQAKELI